MISYDTELLSKMCAQVDLVEYASQTVEFNKRGDSGWVAHCPRHIDRTPSLTITHKGDDEPDLFFCFSCHVGGTIINWMETFEGLKFTQAVEKLSKITGTELRITKQSETVKFYKKIKSISEVTKTQNIVRHMLSDDYMCQFEKEVPEEWEQEGISPKVMEEYGIRVDHRSNRIVYPIYDADDRLIGAKGRTRYSRYKELNIQKYQFYNKIGTTDFFVGMHENKQQILDANEVIIFEGIKSGMKLTTYENKRNWLAAETSYLNDDQVKILLKMQIKNVVIAFDQDVSLDKIKKCTENLRKFTNVYAVIDKRKLLEEKMSPVDKGREVWDELYKERIRI